MPKQSPQIKRFMHAVERGAISLGRWATTDHLQVADLCKAKLGFWNTLLLIFASLILRTLGVLASVAVFYAMLFYGLPWFLFGHLP